MSKSSFANDGITGTPFERHLDGVFVASEAGVILGSNERLLEWTGYKRGELVGRHFQVLFNPEFWSSLDRHAQGASQGSSRRFSARCSAKDGREIEVVATLIGSSEPLGVIGILRDADAAIATLGTTDGEMFRRSASRMARLSGWSIDVDTGLTTWGDEMYAILGVRDVAPRDHKSNLMAFCQEPHRTRLDEAITECVAHGSLIDLTIKISDTMGEEFDVHIIGQAQRNGDGRVVHVEGALYDVTGVMRERDRELVEDRRVIAMFDHVKTALFIIDREWKIHYANQAGLELTHLTGVRLDTVTVWELFPEVEFGEIGRVFRTAMEDGVFGATTQRVNALDGDFEVVVHSTPDGILISARNVTEELDARRQLDELALRTESLAAMLDLTQDAVIVRDLTDEVTYWNRAAEELYGWTFDEVRGRSPLTFMYDDTSVIEEVLATVVREGYWSGELVQRTREGRPLIVQSRLSLSRDAFGQPAAIFVVNSDVTELRQKEEARIRAQRMESLGTLAGGIAHDLNNVLTPMVMSLDILMGRTVDERDRRLLESMNSSVTRASQMVRQVLTFARGVEGERVVVPIERLLRQVQEFCRDVLPKSIDVIFDVTNELGAVVGDETQLMQVLINLVTNARDAMNEGGILTIRARNIAERDRDLDEQSRGLWVAITVSDTGHGMNVETQARVFEPFFTTKQFGEGTGLGLSTSTAIVESHGGRLFLDSESGRGTTFTVEIPCESDAGPHEAAPTARQGRLLPARRSRLLIIDDEEAIVTLLRDVLGDSGYDVDAVLSADSALTLLRDGPATYDLIVSDVNMPKLGGAQFARKARQLGVTTTIAFMSGVSSDSLREELGDEAVRHYLQKPFTVSQLLDFVDETIASPS